jgi:uncharacterized protein (TIGR02246 family)
MGLVRVLVAFAYILLAAVTQAAAQSPQDDQAVQRLAAQFERAWNAHDMTLLGDMVTDDVDFVNVIGLPWKGRQQVVQAHVTIHQNLFKNSVWANERVTVQFIRPDVAIARVEWNTRGDMIVDATGNLEPGPPRRGMFLWVVVKDAGEWRIRAVQNTERQTPRLDGLRGSGS